MPLARRRAPSAAAPTAQAPRQLHRTIDRNRRCPQPGVRAVDFQFDVTTDGRPVKIVSIVDEHTRECLGGMVERSITGEHLIAELDRLAGQRGTLSGGAAL
jgi:putative transposase